MFVSGFEPNHKKDTFGNLIVFLPYGKAGKLIEGYDGLDDYLITEEELKDVTNNDSLVGLPVVVFHPDAMITPDTPYREVGVCLGRWRKNARGVYEVQARITCKKTIRAILRKELTETSPGYLSKGLSRVYNHLALTIPDAARGGREMDIKLESHKITTPTMTPDQIKDIAEQVISSMRTEAETFQDMLASAKTEGAETGYLKGVREGRLIARAEAHGFKPEEGKTFLESYFVPVVGKYLPSLVKKECCAEEQMAYVEAGLEIADAQMMAAKDESEEMSEEETEEMEEMKSESKTIKTPRLEGFSQSTKGTPTRKSGNFLLS